APRGTPAPHVNPRPSGRGRTRRGRGLSVLGPAGEGVQRTSGRAGGVGESDTERARTIASRARRHPARTAGGGGSGGTPCDAARKAGPPARGPRPRPPAAPAGAGGARRPRVPPAPPPAAHP